MTVNHGVLGSSPCSGAIFLREGCRRFRTLRLRPQRGLRNTVWIAYSGVFRDGFAVPSHFYGSLAQLVQSICLTSRGSGVRIPQLPLQRKTIGFPIVFFVCPRPKAGFRRFAKASAALPNKKGRNTVPPIRPAAVGEVYMGLRGGGCIRLRLTSRGRRAMALPFESLNSHYGERRLVFQSSFLFVRVGRKTFPGNRSCFAANIGFFRNTFL